MSEDRDLIRPPVQQFDGSWRAASGWQHEATPQSFEVGYGRARMAVIEAWGAWVRAVKLGHVVPDVGAPEPLYPRPTALPDNTGAIPW